MRDARYIQNTENRCLIFELYDKHVGLNFWIAMQYGVKIAALGLAGYRWHGTAILASSPLTGMR
jgi:hypothetical protein